MTDPYPLREIQAFKRRLPAPIAQHFPAMVEQAKRCLANGMSLDETVAEVERCTVVDVADDASNEDKFRCAVVAGLRHATIMFLRGER